MPHALLHVFVYILFLSLSLSVLVLLYVFLCVFTLIRFLFDLIVFDDVFVP